MTHRPDALATSTSLWPRRHFLHLLGTTALASQLPSQAWAEPGTLSANAQAWRAMARVGYGPTAALVREVLAAGSPPAWALQQLDAAFDASRQAPVLAQDYADLQLTLPELFAKARAEREARKQLKENPQALASKDKPDRMALMNDAGSANPALFSRSISLQAVAWRLRSCSEPAQENPLLARLTEYWFNHLNVYIGKGAVRPFVGHYAIHVARAHALGKFEDLLLASARHPAMLLYLDQVQSVAQNSPGAQGRRRGLNENYARELMELHTLGVDGGYSQNDVRELARVLTGWTTSPNEDSGFQFTVRSHDNGQKTVLGRSFGGGAQQGEQEGVDAIRMLARHPNTAQRVCLRLARFFVSDQPKPALVARLKSTFLATQGDLRAVMRELIASEDFWAAENTLFRTPMDYACATLAATHNGADTADSPRHLLQAAGFLNSAGQPVFGWQTPDGYAFDAATWDSPEALTRRADFALNLGRGADTEFLAPYLSPATLAHIAQERPALRAGLMLASPDAMFK
jgi:uncharacterized protein (DUF1800 family)